MQIKSVLFGFGLGLVLLSAVVLIAYEFEGRQIVLAEDEAVMAQAAELGMVWPTDDVAEVVKKALELGMIFGDEDGQDGQDGQNGQESQNGQEGQDGQEEPDS